MNSMTKINCLNCNKEAYVETREVKRGNGKFCCRNCSAQHRAKNLTPPAPNVNRAYWKKSFNLNESQKKNSRSGLYFCCREHKDISQRIGGIKEIQPPHYGETHSNYRTLMFKVVGKPKQCERCKYDTHEAAIVVHHIDRDRSNNDISNLEVLCANCHAIEHWGE